MRKIEVAGLIVLFVGVALLIFTFLNAYWFLTKEVGLIATGDLVEAFGELLGPLIATCIRIMYLGVMGWIGSLLTMRGISLLKEPVQHIERKVQQRTVAPAEKAEEKAKIEKKEEPARSPQAEAKPVTPPPQQPSESQKTAEPPKPEMESKEKKTVENTPAESRNL